MSRIGNIKPIAEPVVVAVPFIAFGDQPHLFQQVERLLGLDRFLNQPVSQCRREAEPETAHDVAVELAFAQVEPGRLCHVAVEEALLKLLRCPPYDVKHTGAAGSMLSKSLIFQRNSRPARQHFQRFQKADMLDFLNKTEHVAVFITGPAAEGLSARIDVERRIVIVVKRTEPLMDGAGLAQRDVFADDVDDVVGFLDAVFQGCPVFRQGTPTRDDPVPRPKSALPKIVHARPIRQEGLFYIVGRAATAILSIWIRLWV